MRQAIPMQYRRPMVGQLERSYRNSLIASSALGFVFLLAVWLIPKPVAEVQTIDAVPERLAKLILEKEKPKPGAPAPAPAPARTTPSESPVVAEAEPKPQPTPMPAAAKVVPRRTETPKVATNRGNLGRERAQQAVTQQVATVTKSLDASLSKLAQVLPTTNDKAASAGPSRARGRERNVRSGRGSGEIGQVATLSSGASADVGSGLGGATVSLGNASEFVIESGGGGGGPGGNGTGGNGSGGTGSGGTGNGSDTRSNASLLAVVRRYAAGIQYCYDDQLRATPELRGKLVLSITVAPDGSVRNVHIAQDKLNSRGVGECVLSQVRGWRFPTAKGGDVTFAAPFVFTPGG